MRGREEEKAKLRMSPEGFKGELTGHGQSIQRARGCAYESCGFVAFDGGSNPKSDISVEYQLTPLCKNATSLSLEESQMLVVRWEPLGSQCLLALCPSPKMSIPELGTCGPWERFSLLSVSLSAHL